MKISDIDINFKTTSDTNNNIVYIDCREKPFELTGIAEGSKEFIRLPEYLMKTVRPPLAFLAQYTSGVRLRFRTDSSYIALKVTLPSVDLMPHMPLTGSSGFDIYSGKQFQMFVSPLNTDTKFERSTVFYAPADNDGFRDVTINFPLYNKVSEVLIGLDKHSNLLPPKKTKYGKVVFYGSSITQGGVASRPGNNYANILAKNLDFELVNLGFSGNAFGDTEIAEYIASIPMNAFVMDYDFNARSTEELENTHEAMYRIIRNKQSDVPIILITNPFPDFLGREDSSKERLDIIHRTYEKAVSEGDKNIYFIDGKTLVGTSERDTCTVDGTHPNDLGFFRMSEIIYPVLKKALG